MVSVGFVTVVGWSFLWGGGGQAGVLRHFVLRTLAVLPSWPILGISTWPVVVMAASVVVGGGAVAYRALVRSRHVKTR